MSTFLIFKLYSVNNMNVLGLQVMSQGEFVQLIAIDFANVSEHVPVAKISLPWQAEGLQGEVEVPMIHS